jgi:hypothetical protein
LPDLRRIGAFVGPFRHRLERGRTRHLVWTEGELYLTSFMTRETVWQRYDEISPEGAQGMAWVTIDR